MITQISCLDKNEKGKKNYKITMKSRLECE